MRRQTRSNTRNNSNKRPHWNLQQPPHYRRSPRHLSQRLPHRLQVLLMLTEPRILRYCRRYQSWILSQYKHNLPFRTLSLFVPTSIELLRTVAACRMFYLPVRKHSSHGPLTDTVLTDLRIVLAAIAEIQDFLIMFGQSATATLSEIVFQIDRSQPRYRGVMSVCLKDRRCRIESVRKGIGGMDESLTLGLDRTIALVDHQPTIRDPPQEMSGQSVHRVTGLRAPSRFTPQVCQKCKRGRPETQLWLLLVLGFHNILIELL